MPDMRSFKIHGPSLGITFLMGGANRIRFEGRSGKGVASPGWVYLEKQVFGLDSLFRFRMRLYALPVNIASGHLNW